MNHQNFWHVAFSPFSENHLIQYQKKGDYSIAFFQEQSDGKIVGATRRGCPSCGRPHGAAPTTGPLDRNILSILPAFSCNPMKRLGPSAKKRVNGEDGSSGRAHEQLDNPSGKSAA
jgi:hypothetical protein